MSPEEIVEAIWERWERDLREWDLEGHDSNAEAKRLATEVVAEVLAEGSGS